MKPTQKELEQWAIDKIKNDYPKDIALLIAIEGHSLESDCHGLCFDYFVPDTDRGYELATTFILDGVGHDLYPRSWERIDNMANFNDDFHMGLGDAIILYSRSEEDLRKFRDYQELQQKNLGDKAFMYRKALEKLDAAMDIFRTLMFEDKVYKVRMGAGYIAQFLSHAIGYMNGKYFKQRLELPIVELRSMNMVPEGFVEAYEDLIQAKTIESLQEVSRRMIQMTRRFLETFRDQSQDQSIDSIDYQSLAGWYEEGSLAFRRMYIHCDEKNPERVFVDALVMQNEFNIICQEFGLKEVDLMGPFDADHLDAFKKNAKEVEAYIIETIESKGVRINAYGSLDEFLRANS